MGTRRAMRSMRIIACCVSRRLTHGNGGGAADFTLNLHQSGATVVLRGGVEAQLIDEAADLVMFGADPLATQVTLVCPKAVAEGSSPHTVAGFDDGDGVTGALKGARCAQP